MIEKKRLILSDKAIHRARVIEEYEQGNVSRSEASLILDLSERQVSRLKDAWVRKNILGLEHGNYQRISPKKTPPEIVDRIERLAIDKYRNFNFKHFHEKLAMNEGIDVSYSTVKRICGNVGVCKRPKRSRKIRKVRKRMVSPGLMLQMDGSDHEWTRGKRWTLVSGIDDATSEIPYGEFFPTESMESYLAVLAKNFEKKGIPRILYVDRASWLSGTSKHPDTSQFERICKELGMRLIHANSAEGKGRIERAWDTFQDRLVAELGLYGVETMDSATAYLNEKFLPETWNTKFVVLAQNNQSSYQVAPSKEALREIFAYKYPRKVRKDHTVLWGNRTYAIRTELSHSIARRTAEIRLYPDGTIKGYYAGIDLGLEKLIKVEDRPERQSITPGLTALETQKESRKGTQES